jgi:hypothetical protein
LPSWAAVEPRPPGLPRELSLREQLTHVWGWLRGTRPSVGQRTREANVIAVIVAEAEADEPDEPVLEVVNDVCSLERHDGPRPAPRRPIAQEERGS